MNNPSKLYSVLNNRCPRCHKGHFFKTDHAYDLKNFDKMNADCNHCGESFIQEPGFYFGAMYMSYACYVVLTAIFFGGYALWPTLNMYYVLGTLFTLMFILWPLFFRWGRLGWINVFVSFDAKAAAN
jgi:uncharacterized protein (DUF983 family)